MHCYFCTILQYVELHAKSLNTILNLYSQFIVYLNIWQVTVSHQSRLVGHQITSNIQCQTMYLESQLSAI